MRITLIHALKHPIVPIEAAFAKLWPDARLMNLLDDSLSADLARDGGLTEAMTERFLKLGRYAAGTGADGILFTCSAFGPCIEAVARAHAPMPVLKPNEAMIEQAVTGAAKSACCPRSRQRWCRCRGNFRPRSSWCRSSRRARWPRSTAAIAPPMTVWGGGVQGPADCDVIALAQYSMARAAEMVAEASGLPVVTTPDSAVLKLKEMLRG